MFQSVASLSLPILTGLLYGLCLGGLNLESPFGWVAWLALVPLHWTLRQATPRQAFGYGWLTGLVAFAGTIYWVITAMHLYGKVPLTVSVLLMLLLATYLGLYVGLYALGVTWMARASPHWVFLGAPCLWVSLELFRTSALSGMPWGLFGYSQYRALTLIQFADITGVYGVSFLLVLVNVAVYQVGCWAWTRWQDALIHPFPWQTLTWTLATVYFVMAYGSWSLGQEAAHNKRTERLSIGIVQANIDQGQKWDQAFRQETMDRYIRLTRQAAVGSDFIIWPEAATPFLYEQEPSYRQHISSLIQSIHTPLLLGSPALRYDQDRRPYLLNSAYLLDATGEIIGRYDKQHLVPFGEYIPLRGLLFFLDKLVVGIGDFQSGPGPKLLTLPPASPHESIADESHLPRPIHFGVAICFEVIFPDLVRRLAKEGSQFLVTITNDAWFGNTVAPYQHFAMVVFRAVENRMAFARAANTGISGLIAPDGRILSATSLNTEQALTGTIPLRFTHTWYTKVGDAFGWACVILTIILLWWGYRNRPIADPTAISSLKTKGARHDC